MIASFKSAFSNIIGVYAFHDAVCFWSLNKVMYTSTCGGTTSGGVASGNAKVYTTPSAIHRVVLISDTKFFISLKNEQIIIIDVENPGRDVVLKKCFTFNSHDTKITYLQDTESFIAVKMQTGRPLSFFDVSSFQVCPDGIFVQKNTGDIFLDANGIQYAANEGKYCIQALENCNTCSLSEDLKQLNIYYLTSIERIIDISSLNLDPTKTVTFASNFNSRVVICQNDDVHVIDVGTTAAGGSGVVKQPLPEGVECLISREPITGLYKLCSLKKEHVFDYTSIKNWNYQTPYDKRNKCLFCMAPLEKDVYQNNVID